MVICELERGFQLKLPLSEKKKIPLKVTDVICVGVVLTFGLSPFLIFSTQFRLFIWSSYHAGDVFYANWDEVLIGATAVVSTLGGFGSDEQMLRINGEANVVAVNAAKEYGQ